MPLIWKSDAVRLAKLDDILSRVDSLESSLKEKDRKIAEESDRTRDEDDFDGTSSSLPENSIASQEPQVSENSDKKCYIWVLVNKTGRTVIFFYEDGSRGRDVLTNFIGDAELKSVISDGYNAYVFIGDGLKAVKESPNLQKTIHQVCLAHLKAKFDKASGLAGDRSADMRQRKY